MIYTSDQLQQAQNDFVGVVVRETSTRAAGPTRGQIFGSPAAESVAKYYAGMRPYWYPVLPLDELPDDKPAGVELLGERVVLAYLNGDIVALQDLCRHYQAPLSLGEIVEWNGSQCLMCPYHGWTYDRGGQCVRIPQLEASRSIPHEARVPAYRAEERYGLVWVCLEEEARFELPDFPEFDDVSFHRGPLRSYEPYRASAVRCIMGSLDDTHYPWVHEGYLGVRSQPEPPEHEVWRDGRTMISRYEVVQPRSVLTMDTSALQGPAGNGGGTGEPELERVTYTNHVAMPNVIRLVKDINSRTQLVIWMATCPHRYDWTSTFWQMVRNYDTDPGRDPEYERFADTVREQDRPIWEGQRPWLLPPFWTKVEMPLRPADLPLVEYQKWLEELDIALDI